LAEGALLNYNQLGPNY